MTKQEIIKAAFKVWGREQYQSTSLAQLARELGVSKPALYRHFKNKQALLEAMYESFFDEYAAFIKPEYDKAIAAQDIIESFFIMIRIMVEYYIRHRDMFIFSLVRLYGDYDMGSMTHRLLSQGIDLRYFLRVEKEALAYPSLIQLIIGHLSFVICYFHRPDQTSEALRSEQAVDEMLAFVEENISCGLGLDKELIDALDYDRLEALCPRSGSRSRTLESIYGYDRPAFRFV